MGRRLRAVTISATCGAFVDARARRRRTAAAGSPWVPAGRPCAHHDRRCAPRIGTQTAYSPAVRGQGTLEPAWLPWVMPQAAGSPMVRGGPARRPHSVREEKNRGAIAGRTGGRHRVVGLSDHGRVHRRYSRRQDVHGAVRARHGHLGGHRQHQDRYRGTRDLFCYFSDFFLFFLQRRELEGLRPRR